MEVQTRGREMRFPVAVYTAFKDASCFPLTLPVHLMLSAGTNLHCQTQWKEKFYSHLLVPFYFNSLWRNIIPYLYRSNGSRMALQDCNWGTGSKTPHSDNLITTACCKQRVLIVNSHVRNLSWVPSQRWEQAPIICSPDFDQAIIWPLMPEKISKDYIK